MRYADFPLRRVLTMLNVTAPTVLLDHLRGHDDAPVVRCSSSCSVDTGHERAVQQHPARAGCDNGRRVVPIYASRPPCIPLQNFWGGHERQSMGICDRSTGRHPCLHSHHARTCVLSSDENVTASNPQFGGLQMTILLAKTPDVGDCIVPMVSALNDACR